VGNRESFPNPLSDPAIIAELNLAWQQSRAHDPAERHEEGGYILLTSDGFLRVERWRRGDQSHIVPPPLDVNGCYNGNEVVAAFHTHPNPAIDEMGQEWEQGPGESDRRWHQQSKASRNCSQPSDALWDWFRREYNSDWKARRGAL